MVAGNSTGCSSIYSGTFPTTPYTVRQSDGQGPSWGNSLFEDNAEFGLGMRLAIDSNRAQLKIYIDQLFAMGTTPALKSAIEASLALWEESSEEANDAQKAVKAALADALAAAKGSEEKALLTKIDELKDYFADKVVWIIGGDGWAYDIGFGGLDHVLSSGRNVNILVLDTEVYSNTGGQSSKSTPRAATAKFASNGKSTRKKDLGLLAQAYGDVYVAQVALGANETQTVRAFREAAAHDGPSLVIAYSTCIAHGIEMSTSMTHQKLAVSSGYWPLYRFHPSPEPGTHPFSLDSKKPTVRLHDFLEQETRFAVLERSDPARAEHLQALAQADVDERWHYYEQLAGVERSIPVDEHDLIAPDVAAGDQPDEPEVVEK